MDKFFAYKRNPVFQYLVIIAGTGLLAFAIKCICDPINLVTGGFTGLSILLKDLTDMILDTNTHIVKIGSMEIKLTRTEYAILKLLMQNPTQVVTKSLLLDRISTDTPDCTESSLKMHISNLRKKLRKANNRDYIEAVWGIGFKMRAE